MEELFQKEITFLSKVLDIENPANGFALVPVTKKITFKELSRTDRAQHKLHFMLISIFTGGESNVDDTDEPGKGGSFNVNTDKLYDITAKAIRVLVVTDDNFNDQEKTELLNDGGALFRFGMWLLKEKISPFFSELMKG